MRWQGSKFDLFRPAYFYSLKIMKQIAKTLVILLVAFALWPSLSFAQSQELAPKSGIADRPASGVDNQEVIINKATPKDGTVPVSDIKIPRTSIQVQRISWDTFEFRPSLQFGDVPQSFQWDFGDGKSSMQRVVEHTFNGPGNYIVGLTILNQDGTVQMAEDQAHIGFFHLANWRLWVAIVVLALIIIVAAILAGLKEDRPVKKKKTRSKNKHSIRGDETVINSLAESSGDFDIWASTGIHKNQLKKELTTIELINGRIKRQKKATKLKSRKAAIKKTSTKRTKKNNRKKRRNN